jgi:hypothetical protein
MNENNLSIEEGADKERMELEAFLAKARQAKRTEIRKISDELLPDDNYKHDDVTNKEK